MAVFAVRTVKREEYMGQIREFGNTYHYSTDPVTPFPDISLADAIIAQERSITSSEVEFVRLETWGPTDGTKFDNVMRERIERNLLGLGTAQDTMYREVCGVVAFPMPRSPTTNRRRWLRKFIRLPALGGAAFLPAQLSGRQALTTAQKDSLVAFGNAIREITIGGVVFPLVSEKGVRHNAPALARPYLITRDIGR